MARLIKYHLLFLFLFLIIVKKTEAEVAVSDSSIHLVIKKSIKGDFKDFSIDNLGNIYLISTNNQIKKIDSKLDSIAIYSDSKRFGNLFSIDVSNPLKIMVYYRDFATIVILDRQLSIKNVIDLRQHNIFQVSAVAQSFDNKIWLFDEEDNKIKKIDPYGKLLFETPDFRILFNDKQAYSPNQIIDMNGLLYLYHPKMGWKLFDYYGGLKSQYPFLNWQDVFVDDGFLNGHDQNSFFSERPKLQQSYSFQVNIDLKSAKKIVVKQNSYYLLTQDGIQIYTSL